MSIWDSFKEYIPQLLSRWETIAIGAGAGIVLTFIQGVLALTIPGWIWVLVLVSGLITAQFLLYHKVRIQRNRLMIHLPVVNNVDYSPHNKHREGTLSFRNRGAGGRFYATCQIHIGKEVTIPLSLPWRDERTRWCDIPPNGIGLIPFLVLSTNTSTEEGKTVHDIATWQFSDGQHKKFIINRWIEEIEKPPKPFTIFVEITSDPRMLQGHFSEEYIVRVKTNPIRIDTKTSYEALLERLFRPSRTWFGNKE